MDPTHILMPTIIVECVCKWKVSRGVFGECFTFSASLLSPLDSNGVSDDTLCLCVLFLPLLRVDVFLFIYFIFIFDKWFRCSMNRNKSEIPLHFVNGNARAPLVLFCLRKRSPRTVAHCPEIQKWKNFFTFSVHLRSLGSLYKNRCLVFGIQLLGIVFYLLF